MRTTPPGGVFTVARVGRFAVISVNVRRPKVTLRRSLTRKMLSQANEELDPQEKLQLGGAGKATSKTQLAYLGCLVSVPSRADPTVPAELAFAVPAAALDGWLFWSPLHRVHALLQERVDAGATRRVDSGTIPDRAFPKFRLPEEGTESGDGV
jgi:hypothetical protein